MDVLRHGLYKSDIVELEKCFITFVFQTTSSCINPPAITKNRALNIFDSPEEGKRGWSELGLRIKREPRPVEDESQSITGEGYFNHMADELVLSIFKSMPKRILAKCARVCKRWRRLA